MLRCPQIGRCPLSSSIACPVHRGVKPRPGRDVKSGSHAHLLQTALRKRGAPVAYIEFPGEGHGFRKAENTMRATEAELYFYGRVFGFTPAGDLPRVEIENLPGG